MNGYGRTHSPCQKCEKRQTGCHATCRDYAEYRKVHEREVLTILKNKDEFNKCRTGYMTDKQFKSQGKGHSKNKVFKQTMR